MSRLQSLCAILLTSLGLAAHLPAQARPVTYTLVTVADGQLGSLSFTAAPLTFSITSDTRNVQSHLDASGNLVYTNAEGTARVSVTVAGQTTSAVLAHGEWYLHLNTGTGVFGIGSPIDPTYPIALGCASLRTAGVTQDCLLGEWGTQGLAVSNWLNGQRDGTATAAADIAAVPADQVYSSPAALALPQNLSQTTLLTGTAHTCAVPYTVDTAGFVKSCDSAAPRGLSTSAGPLFLQDTNTYVDYSQGYTGALRVRVSTDE